MSRGWPPPWPGPWTSSASASRASRSSCPTCRPRSARVYLSDDDAGLQRSAALGLNGSLGDLLTGDGIPGRAAQSRKTVVAGDIPPDSPFTIRLGVDQLPPRMVAAVPMLVLENEVVGVVVIASLRDLTPQDVAFVEQGAKQMAVSIRNGLAHDRIRDLAGTLQERNERLQQQNEEIQAQQEELQTQNEQLQVREEELQQQNEEIQAQQEELQSQNEELHVQGDELRGTVDALRTSEDRYREADRRKNEFLAVLSHELRNPLAPICNSLHVLRRAEPGGEKAQEARAILDRQVKQLSRLVDDLLDIARITNGKIELKRTRIDLSKLVRQVAEDNAGLFTGRGIQFETRIPSRPLATDGDPARIAQIISNLLQNAEKFTPEGGHVTLTLEAPAEDTAVIRVRDTGIGIEANLLPQIFEQFTQGDGSLARSGGGLGLGLALVQGLVRLHGGTVRALSEGPGRGTEFVIELLLDRREIPAEPPRAKPVHVSRRILLIEDNADSAESLRLVLGFYGHSVEVAGDGVEGLRKARDRCPDVLVCDIGLPGMDRYAVARAFRADPALRSVHLIALSGYALPEDKKLALEAGFNAHLSKPVPPEKLEESLSRIEAQEPGVASRS